MVPRCVPFLIALTLLVPARGQAQSPGGGYVAVIPAVSAGDGGAAPSISASAGYITAHRIGFEVEFNYTDRLDLLSGRIPILDLAGLSTVMAGVPGIPRAMLDDLRALGLTGMYLPQPSNFSSSARLLSFQTNAVGEIVTTRRVRASVSAGGGIASLRQRMHLRIVPVYPPLPLGRPFVEFPIHDRIVSSSDTGLSLDAGLTMEYRATRRTGIAGDVRYQHVFLQQNDFDVARVGGRFVWRF